MEGIDGVSEFEDLRIQYEKDSDGKIKSAKVSDLAEDVGELTWSIDLEGIRA